MARRLRTGLDEPDVKPARSALVELLKAREKALSSRPAEPEDLLEALALDPEHAGLAALARRPMCIPC